jgi:hypothetical protein
MGVPIDQDGAAEIALRSRGTPRIANRLLRRVRDYAQVRGSGVIDRPTANAALTMLEVDAHGFDEIDRKLLLAIIQKYGGGPVGLGTLAATLAEEEDALEEVYEPFLIQIGFLDRTPRGRVATRWRTNTLAWRCRDGRQACSEIFYDHRWRDAMALTESTMLELGTIAPDFALTDVVSGKAVRRDDFRGTKALLVMFICTHCPYVKHVEKGLAALGNDYARQPVGHSGHQFKRCFNASRRCSRGAQAAGRELWLSTSLTSTTKRRPWRMRTRRHALRTSFFSIELSSWCTAGSSMEAGQATACP